MYSTRLDRYLIFYPFLCIQECVLCGTTGTITGTTAHTIFSTCSFACVCARDPPMLKSDDWGGGQVMIGLRRHFEGLN